MKTMKAIVHDVYGSPDVLELRDIPIPVPKAKEILIKVHATTATTAEGGMRRGEPAWGRLILGMREPKRKVLGLEVAGEVVSVGSAVTRFKVGERVFGFTGFGCGGYAQYVVVPESASVIEMPKGVSFDEAVGLVDGSTTALHFLRDRGRIQPGQKVLIHGASGSIGTAAVQLARFFGAEVTGVCSTRNLELVKSLGAHHVVDYTKEDFTQAEDAYDIIFDVVGKSSFAACKAALKDGGRYLITVMGFAAIAQTLWTALFGRKKVIFSMSIEKVEGLQFIKGLVEAGKLRPVVESRYPMARMREAHQLVDTGHKRGSVVISVDHAETPAT